VPLNETVEPLRAVKSAEELQLIRRAAAITDSVAAQIPALIRPGMTERELSWELEKRLRESGANGTAFPIIVASGPNAALPHHASGDRMLQRGDALIVDMGAAVSGYMSDLTRSFFLGETPDAQYAAVYDAVQEAQRRALAGMRAGMTGRAVDALARDRLVEAGYGDHFGHGLGHSLGLEIHEQPRLSRLNEKPLPAGVVLTVEPGVYLPGWGGVRLEDLVLLTEAGVEVLSACPHVGVAPL
jgi:Xaa-Pro aminopeptidase